MTSCAAAVMIGLVAVATEALQAQRIYVTDPPTRISAVDGRKVAPINHVTLDSKDRVLILGGPSGQELFLLNNGAGTPVSSIALSQIGAPLAAATSATFDGPNTIAIVDSKSPRWARVRLAGGRWAVDTLTSTDLSGVSSICSIGGRRFVMAKKGARHTDGTVHEVTRAGAVIRSFGKPFAEIENPAVGYGHILCLPRQRTIVITSRLYPEVRAYTVNGDERWTTPVPSFEPLGFEEDGRLIRFAYPADSTWDQTVSLFSPSPGVVAIQVGRQRGRSYSRPYDAVRTFYVSVQSGDVLGSQTGLPVVMTASSKRLYAMPNRNRQELHVYTYNYRVR